MALTVDEILQQGRYRVRKHLGQGGMGTVYLAEDRNLSRQLVAIKENTDTSQAAQEQFQQEAMILSRLSHPNLPRVTDHFIEESGRQYLVMDYIQGEDFREIALKQAGPLPEAQVLAWIDQVLDALEYMHIWDDAETGQPNSIVHRDIKPGNIKRTPNGRIVLVDFGLAKYQTDMGTHIGARGISPGYSPLEQYTGGTDVRSDIYAVGATLYTLLTGVRPPDAPMRAAGTQLPPLRKLNSSLTRKTERVIQRAMQMQVTERFQSVAHMRAALTGNGPRRILSPPLAPKRNQASGQMPLFLAESKRRHARPFLSPVALGIGLCLLLLIIASAPGMPLWNWGSGTDNLVEKLVARLALLAPATSPATSSVTDQTITPAAPLAGMIESSNTSTTTMMMVADAITATTPTPIVSTPVTTAVNLLPVPPAATAVATVTPSVTNMVTATPPPIATAALDPAPGAAITQTSITATQTTTTTSQPTVTHTDTPTDAPTATTAPVATATAPPTLQPTATTLPTATTTPDLAATAAVIQAVVKATLTAIATAMLPTATSTQPSTSTAAPTATATPSATPTPSAMNTATSTLPPTAIATWTRQPTAIPTVDLTATAAVMHAAIKATLTAIAAAIPSTATPTATAIPTQEPTATKTNTATPTPLAPATATHTPDLTATLEVVRAAVNATLTALVTFTPTFTPTSIPTYTLTPSATPSFTPTAKSTATATNRPTPTPTRTPRPKATATLTPVPTKTFTALPTNTNTATTAPTATNTATPVPLAPTATNTATPVLTPLPSSTPTPVPVPVPVDAAVTLIEPLESVLSGVYTFRWTTNVTLGENQFYEMVFWPAGQDPLNNGFGPAGASATTALTIDLNKASDILPKLFVSGRDYEWGILLVELNPYHRLQYLGGSQRFHFERSGSSSGSNSGGNNDSGNDKPTPTPRG